MKFKNVMTFVLLFLVTFTGILMVQAKANKVALCHLDEEGNLFVIEISENAVPAHVAHGDQLIGVDVDENCDPLVISITMRDSYNYLWELELNTGTGDMVGTLDGGAPWLWNAFGNVNPADLFDTNLASSVTLIAVNPNGCGGGYTSDFTYVGDRTTLGTNDFNGTWQSFCDGPQSGAGSWSGTFAQVLSLSSLSASSSVSGGAGPATMGD